ncbi:MAG: vWA domain-containing protein [Verrucomicrobiia bacterium]
MRAACRALICLLAFAALANGQTNFYIQGIEENADGSISITWPAVPNWTYHVMYANSPSGPWQDFSDGQLAAGTNVWTLCYTDTNSVTVSQRFYKIRTGRPQVIMTLVLDRSGSMNPVYGTTRGGGALPGAVSTFLSYFNDSYDEAAMVSFGSTATVDVPMGQPFQQAISTAASNLNWCGGTFAAGGLTNALVQENSVIIPKGQVALKVVIFFTDGLANMIQDTLSCSPSNSWIFGGIDPPNTGVFFFNSNTPNTCSGQNDGCYISDGGSASSCGCDASQFYSNQNGVWESFTRANVTAEAQYRAIQVANQIRSNNIWVYSIGLGGAGVDMSFLEEVANDPSSPTYNPMLPTGVAVIANDPSGLQAVFQQIASQLLTY